MNYIAEQPDLFTGSAIDQPIANFPAHRGVETSIAAAFDLAPHLGRLQQLSLDTIEKAGWHGCTALELAGATGLPREAVQPRTTELRKAGKIIDSRRRRPNPNGKMAIVWILPQFERSEVA